MTALIQTCIFGKKNWLIRLRFYENLLPAFILPSSLCAQSIVRYYNLKEEPIEKITDITNSIGAEFFKNDSAWAGMGFFVSSFKPAFQISFLDKELTERHGPYLRWNQSGYLEEMGSYHQNKKQGPWWYFRADGGYLDSSIYKNGKKIGTALSWDQEGNLIDSAHWDGNGKGNRVCFHSNGVVFFAGRYESDTLKFGKWIYRHDNNVLAAEVIWQKGVLQSGNYYDENGKQYTDTGGKMQEFAKYKWGEKGWRNWLASNLNMMTPINNGAPVGTYTVKVSYTIDTDGTFSNVKASTQHVYGMEQEAVRVLSRGKNWTPAMYREGCV